MAKEQTETWSLKDELLEMKAMIIRMDIALRGNGKDGLITKVRIHDVRIKLLMGAVSLVISVSLAIIGKLIYDRLS